MRPQQCPSYPHGFPPVPLSPKDQMNKKPFEGKPGEALTASRVGRITNESKVGRKEGEKEEAGDGETNGWSPGKQDGALNKNFCYMSEIEQFS